VRTLSLTIPGTPIPQARARHRVMKLRSGQTFVGQYDPAESRIWKATVAEFSAKATAGQPPIKGAIVLEAVFVFLPPGSFPKRKLAQLAAGVEIPKITRPDLKNLIAGIEDGANGILWRDDGQIAGYANSRKVFGLRAETRITVTALEEAPSNRHPVGAVPLLPLEGVLP
jgi:Holliday junction resolvase RusA-like endonuclease